MPHLSVSRSPPEARQATVLISLSTTSPIFSLANNSSFSLNISARINSPRQPNTPITLSIRSTLLDTSRQPPIDTLALGFFTSLRCISDPDKPSLSLGIFQLNEQHRDPPSDLRQRPWENLLVLPGTSPSSTTSGVEEGMGGQGASVKVSHPLPLERILLHAGEEGKGVMQPGDRWGIALSSPVQKVAAWWWTWGALDESSLSSAHGLADKKLSAWRKGGEWFNFGVEKPSMMEWVVGENPENLWLEVGEGRAECEFNVVE